MNTYTRLQAQQVALRYMNQHGLIEDGWTFRIGRASARRCGECNYRNRVITVGITHIQASPRAEVDDTILHEIAHALAGYQANHGPEWQRVCARIGASPERMADHSVLTDMAAQHKPKWRVTCSKCGVVIYRNRRLRGGRNGVHTVCGGSMQWEQLR